MGTPWDIPQFVWGAGLEPFGWIYRPIAWQGARLVILTIAFVLRFSSQSIVTHIR
jgi:hypothetical protein